MNGTGDGEEKGVGFGVCVGVEITGEVAVTGAGVGKTGLQVADSSKAPQTIKTLKQSFLAMPKVYTEIIFIRRNLLLRQAARAFKTSEEAVDALKISLEPVDDPHQIHGGRDRYMQ
jgi:hypothetical protein